jgi:uncharacterized protein
MKQLISIVEIPGLDFRRAVSFYQSIFDIIIEEVDMNGIELGLFSAEGQDVFVQIIRGNHYEPSIKGTIVYFNAGDDLQVVVGKIEKHGGKIVVPKTEIGPGMGYYALFIDTEGNQLGLHSPH